MIGERLKKLRKEKEWSQRKVAELIGISRGNYAHYETNSKIPGKDNLQKLADLFEVSTDFLLGRTDERRPAHELKKEVQSNTLDLAKLLHDGFRLYYDGKLITKRHAKLITNFLEVILNEDEKED